MAKLFPNITFASPLVYKPLRLRTSLKETLEIVPLSQSLQIFFSLFQVSFSFLFFVTSLIENLLLYEINNFHERTINATKIPSSIGNQAHLHLTSKYIKKKKNLSKMILSFINLVLISNICRFNQKVRR